MTTYWSGEVDKSDLCFTESHPLRELLGIRTEELDIRPEHTKNYICYNHEKYEIADFCELIHPETAEVLATYDTDFYAGQAALTRNRYGKGTAYYIAAEGNVSFLKQFFKDICSENHIANDIADVLPEGVYLAKRENDSCALYFLQNYNSHEVTIELKTPCRNVETGEIWKRNIRLRSYEVTVLMKPE